MQELVKIAKALSDETRIRMLKLLLQKDICVCEMEGIFPLSVSQLTRNCKMLMEAGFLQRWREGKCVVYIADKEKCNHYCRALLDLIDLSFNDNEAALKDQEKLSKAIADGIREKKK
jgi:ArsR family transcriptional regulator